MTSGGWLEYKDRVFLVIELGRGSTCVSCLLGMMERGVNSVVSVGFSCVDISEAQRKLRKFRNREHKSYMRYRGHAFPLVSNECCV